MKKDLAYWADQAFNIEKMRVSAQVSITHLAKHKVSSPERERLLEMLMGVEKFVDGYMAEIITSHPTWPWASRFKGIGKENLPKVVGLIDAFGKYYDVDDPMIPPYVKRTPELYYVYDAKNDKTLEKTGIFVSGIERLTNPSKLWKYAGFHVVDGHAPKRKSGKLLGFNMQLRMAIYRLGLSLIKQVRENGRGFWRWRYDEAYAEITSHCAERGVKIIPTPSGRICLKCEKVVELKASFYCPDCGEKLSFKKEEEGYLFKGHLHSMALREMLKDWLLCLWLVWREAEGLPVTPAYEVARLGHEPINPWGTVDKDEKNC